MRENCGMFQTLAKPMQNGYFYSFLFFSIYLKWIFVWFYVDVGIEESICYAYRTPCTLCFRVHYTSNYFMKIAIDRKHERDSEISVVSIIQFGHHSNRCAHVSKNIRSYLSSNHLVDLRKIKRYKKSRQRAYIGQWNGNYFSIHDIVLAFSLCLNIGSDSCTTMITHWETDFIKAIRWCDTGNIDCQNPNEISNRCIETMESTSKEENSKEKHKNVFYSE